MVLLMMQRLFSGLILLLPLLKEVSPFLVHVPQPTSSRQSFLHVHSSTSSSSEGVTSNKKDSRVIYQKVVKSPTSTDGNLPLFLGHLVEYLQDQFELPQDLPMVYHTILPTTNDNDDNSSSNNCVTSWDSPMSASTDATRMMVEVVAIYTDQHNDEQSLPPMAMVAVRKMTHTSKPLSPMTQNLFDASEKQILKALDRGLDQFAAGKLDSSSKKSKKPQDMQDAQTAMIEEMLEDAAVSHPSLVENNSTTISATTPGKQTLNVLDAEVESSSDSADIKNTLESPKQDSAAQEEEEDDFAVRAAKVVAGRNKPSSSKQPTKKTKSGVDFAVAQAQKVAKARKDVPKSSKKEKKQTKTATTTTGQPIPASSVGISGNASPMMESIKRDGQNRAFRTVVSRPQSRGANAKSREQATAEKRQSSGGSSDTKPLDVKEAAQQAVEQQRLAAKAAKKNKKKAADQKPQKEEQPLAEETKHQKTKETKKAADQKAQKEQPLETKNSSPTAKKRAVEGPSDQEIMQTARDVMEELSNQSQDMTPEELLEDVLKFGAAQDKENEIGTGFVAGAFEKAKELLREQKRNRDEKVKAQVVEQVTQEHLQQQQQSSPANDKQHNVNVRSREVSSEEEELRRIFEAGVRAADSHMTAPTTSQGGDMVTKEAMSEEDAQQVDDLIAGDKSVSNHARILDDELAELEVRINQSPGGAVDRGPNPLFDIFSGPETYNPNVDPATAVNWPGALPGTATTTGHLPKELTEAVKQAEFAAEVLQNLEVREEESGEKAFFVGKRQLSAQQVENLQSVAAEAVEIGIIPNPLVLMEERGRLQMVLDELWNQDEDRRREIVSNYKDLLLSDNFVALIKERLREMADRDIEALRQRANDEEEEGESELEQRHTRERELLGQLVVTAQLLLKEARAIGAELEAQQIEVIRSICKVAMDPSHRTEEETAAALTDTVRDMRPLFDDMFIAYLKYAVAEEEGRLARAGVLDDPEHNQWLFVLRIVQQGVHAEIAKGINRYVEHIWYVLRMETPIERKLLLAKLIDDMPTLDVRPFVRVVDNIVSSLGEVGRGELKDGAYELGNMTNKLLQLHRDMKELLPPERIEAKSRDADEWAAKQKKRMVEQRKLAQQRLKAARETEEYDGEIDSIGMRGETERFS
ncbi:expressed unknown protein [Seminavis robusta]|uniref:Uncharacterized protein n=1 Tax=Seminavis robusta TaxID=568900 RepID=A0A9N8ETR0_9STRA|nr:expressed unknown protein [Seminavis robusta]|eukprot:Sro1940_g306650.1 n/a (1151) ;mRNA; f:12370-15822